MQARGQLRLTWRLYAESPQSGEISPPLMVRAALRGRSLGSEYHGIDPRLSPIPARTSARDDDVGERPSRHFDRSEASGEISPSDGTGGITVGDLSTQSIMGAFSICPTPTRSPARDDDGSERPSRHFDRSEAEWRNLLSPMVHEAWRQEISELRVPIEPRIPARSPVEMTRGSP